VHSLGLEEDGVAGVPPKVGDGIAAVTATWLDLQSAAATALVGTGLALLLPPRLFMVAVRPAPGSPLQLISS